MRPGARPSARYGSNAADQDPARAGDRVLELPAGADDREDLPRKLLFVLARRKPPLDFLELSGAGIRIPHAFPPGFTLASVLRITLQELKKLPLRDTSS